MDEETDPFIHISFGEILASFPVLCRFFTPLTEYHLFPWFLLFSLLGSCVLYYRRNWLLQFKKLIKFAWLVLWIFVQCYSFGLPIQLIPFPQWRQWAESMDSNKDGYLTLREANFEMHMMVEKYRKSELQLQAESVHELQDKLDERAEALQIELQRVLEERERAGLRRQKYEKYRKSRIHREAKLQRQEEAFQKRRVKWFADHMEMDELQVLDFDMCQSFAYIIQTLPPNTPEWVEMEAITKDEFQVMLAHAKAYFETFGFVNEIETVSELRDAEIRRVYDEIHNEEIILLENMEMITDDEWNLQEAWENFDFRQLKNKDVTDDDEDYKEEL